MILIISKDKRLTKSLHHILRLQGLLTKEAKPEGAMQCIDTSLSAIFVLSPESFLVRPDYWQKLETIAFGTPIFALSSEKERFREFSSFSAVFDLNGKVNHLLAEVQRVQRERMCRLSGEYRLLDIDASISKKVVSYCGVELPLTKKERAILRYFISKYPNSVSTDDIVRAIYEEECIPEKSCIRAHICAINKKFRKVLLTPLIVSVRGEGYKIDTTSLSVTGVEAC